MDIPLVAVSTENLSLREEAAVLAQSLQLPLTDPDSTQYLYLLNITPEKLVLKNTRLKNTKAIYVDFLSPKLLYRQRNHQRELLKKAIGSPNLVNHVIDATAGLGEDAFILASKGYSVLMLERSKILAKLLEDGLKRYYAAISSEKSLEILHSPNTEILTNNALTLIHADAKNYLPLLAQKISIDVIYLDPMFPDRQKTALPRKEMAFLRELIGQDTDAHELLAVALNVAKRRVVVKRSRLAEPLGNLNPSFSLSGKISRFDVYCAKGHSIKAKTCCHSRAGGNPF